MKVLIAYLDKYRTRAMAVEHCPDPIALKLEEDQHQIPVNNDGELILMGNLKIPVISGPLNPEFFSAIKVSNTDDQGRTKSIYRLRFKYRFVKNQAKLDELMKRPGMVGSGLK